jgi:hypothetical protein
MVTRPAFFDHLMGCYGLTSAESTALWGCLPREGQEQIAARVHELLRRKPLTPSADDAAELLLRTLHPHGLLASLDAAAEAGQVTRGVANAVTDKLVQQMDQRGAWK